MIAYEKDTTVWAVSFFIICVIKKVVVTPRPRKNV